MNKNYNKISNFQIFIFYLWFLLFLIIFIFIIIFYAANKGYLGSLPFTENLKSIEKMNVGSEIYDINGDIIGRFYSSNKNLVLYHQIPKHFIYALLSKEDIRFNEHSGIDERSFLRAILTFGKKGGGSTISQQLAKLLFTGKSAKNRIQRIHQKILEWIMAIELEKRYTKKEIITMYCNKFDFLYNSIGIYNAAKTYFNKKPSNLSIIECATLVGMLENPSLYNPKNYPYRSKKQRNLVLKQMKKYNFITYKKYKSSLYIPIKLNFNTKRNDFSLYTYYGEYLKEEIKDCLSKYEKKTGINLNIYSGLKIYTTINKKIQKYAEKSVFKHLKHLQNEFDKSQYNNNKNSPFINISIKESNNIIIESMKKTVFYNYYINKGLTEDKIINLYKKPSIMTVFTWDGNKKLLISPWDLIRYKKSIIQGGLLSIESNTGNINAWVGGVDFNHFKYDHVEQTKRQVGSIFKPIVYAAAINKFNYDPCTKISNEKFDLGNWTPKNSNGKYGGMYTLKDGLALSINTISARLIKKTTTKPVINLAHIMGIKSSIPNNPSIAIGSADISLYEMTGAFNVFTNYGSYIKPHIVLKITDKHNRIIFSNEKKYFKYRIFNDRVNNIILNLMNGVVKYGTAKRLIYKYNMNGEMVGKTGTTNGNSDGWYIGMIPKLTTGIWVGWENRSIHFDSRMGQGSSMALPIWAFFIKELYNDENLTNFNSKLVFKKNKNYEEWNKCGMNYNINKYNIKLKENNEFINRKNINDNIEKKTYYNTNKLEFENDIFENVNNNVDNNVDNNVSNKSLNNEQSENEKSDEAIENKKNINIV